MPQRVYNNVVNHRLLDGGSVVEDITKVGLPTITHSTTEINAAGMAMAVNMPDATHIEAMDFTITHNNGVNCNLLAAPGKHVIEFRTARQRYDVPDGEIVFESVKYRVIGVHTETQKGDIETGSPFGSTEKFSLLRYEEEVNGTITTVLDAMAGTIKYNGNDYTSVVESLLA